MVVLKFHYLLKIEKTRCILSYLNPDATNATDHNEFTACQIRRCPCFTTTEYCRANTWVQLFRMIVGIGMSLMFYPIYNIK